MGPSGLNGAFDLGVVVFVLHEISQETPMGTGSTPSEERLDVARF
jgi:hypothetical protein